MFCSNCGRQVGDTDRFCHYCGAALQDDSQSVPQSEPQSIPQSEPQPGQQSEPPQSEPLQSEPPKSEPPQSEPPKSEPPKSEPPQPPQMPPAPSGNQDSLELALKIFALVCAVVYVLRGLQQALNFVSGLVILFEYFPVYILPTMLLSLLGALVYFWITAMLVLLAFRRTPANTRGLTLGLLAGGALALILLVLNILIVAINFQIFNAGLLPHILGVLVSVGGVYGLLHAIGQAPSADSLLQNPAADLQDACASIGDGVRSAQQGAQQNAQQRAQQNASAAAAAYAAGGTVTGGPVKTDRSLLLYIVLSIVTCGFYSWYFIYCLARDVNTVCREDGQNTSGLLAFILLSFITCGFYALYWEYALGNRLAANAPRYGMTFQENGTTVLLWYLVGLFLCGIGPYVAMYILIKNTNTLAIAYNRANGY